MLSCTEEGKFVGVGGFMFWQILPSISFYVWFLEGLYTHTQQIYYAKNKYVWCLTRDTLLRDTSSVIGPD